MPNKILDGEIKRENNFGFLRLLFASLVIISHSPELIDGNKSREILTRVFGTLSFGKIAVDAFFIISGYLITKSFVEKKSIYEYFIKRIFRIFPGYIASFFICSIFIAPFVGAHDSVFSFQNIKHNISNLLLILPPDIPGSFDSLPYHSLNGSMWTIAYEFRCYIAAAILGICGFYKPNYRLFMLCIVAIAVILFTTQSLHNVHIVGEDSLGSPEVNVRLFSAFGIGSLYFIFRDKIIFRSYDALLAATLLILLMFSRYLAEISFDILGGYLIFWFIFNIPVLRASKFDNNTDISYGLYLYAWPIQSLVIFYNRNVNPWILCAITLISGGFAAYLIWKLIESPSLNYCKKLINYKLRERVSA